MELGSRGWLLDFLIVCSVPLVSPKLLRNCLDQPKLNLQRNFVWAGLGLSGFPPRVSHLFYLVWGDNFVTGDFQICRRSPDWRPGTARWWVSYYRTLRDNCQQIGGTKNINYLIKTISPPEKRLNSQLVFLAMINSNLLWSIFHLTAFLDLFR